MWYFVAWYYTLRAHSPCSVFQELLLLFTAEYFSMAWALYPLFFYYSWKDIRVSVCCHYELCCCKRFSYVNMCQWITVFLLGRYSGVDLPGVVIWMNYSPQRLRVWTIGPQFAVLCGEMAPDFSEKMHLWARVFGMFALTSLPVCPLCFPWAFENVTDPTACFQASSNVTGFPFGSVSQNRSLCHRSHWVTLFNYDNRTWTDKETGT